MSNKKQQKRMASFMQAKSTLELKENIEKSLERKIPDPKKGAFDLASAMQEPDSRIIEKKLIDIEDQLEKAKKQDENTRWPK